MGDHDDTRSGRSNAINRMHNPLCVPGLLRGGWTKDRDAGSILCRRIFRPARAADPTFLLMEQHSEAVSDGDVGFAVEFDYGFKDVCVDAFVGEIGEQTFAAHASADADDSALILLVAQSSRRSRHELPAFQSPYVILIDFDPQTDFCLSALGRL